MVFGGGGFGGSQVMGGGGGTLIIGLVPLEDETEEACFLSLLSIVWDHNKKIVLSKPGRWHLPKTHHAGPLGSQDCEKWKIVVSVTKYKVFLL